MLGLSKAIWLNLGVALILALLPMFLMWGGVHGGFIFDDYGNIVFNQKVHLQQWDMPSIKLALSAYDGPIARPLVTLSFALNYWLGGQDAFGYKVVNVLLHGFNTVLVFFFLNLLLKHAWPSAAIRWRKVAAAASSLAWAMHPIQVSSVLYVVQRMEVMAAGFVLAALILYMQGRIRMLRGKNGWLLVTLSALVASAGLLCKESAVLAPLYTLGLEICILRFSTDRQRDKRLLISIYSVACILALLITVWVIPKAEAAYVSRTFTMSERLLTQLRVLPMYLGQMYWPSPSSLVFYYDWVEPSTSLLMPSTTLFGGLFLLALAVSALMLHRARPLYSFGVFFFFAAHLLTSSFIALDLAFEHRNYMALLGVLVAFCEIMRFASARISTSILTAFTVAALVLLGTATTLRALTWANPVVLANSLAQEAPESPRAAYTLGVLMIRNSGGDTGSIAYGLGMINLTRASEMKYASPLPIQAMIIVHAKTGQTIPDRWWEVLVRKFTERAIGAQEQSAYGTLISERIAGLPLSDTRLHQLSELVVQKRPDLKELHLHYAHFAHASLKDRKLALQEYEKAIELTPSGQRAEFVQELMKDMVNKGDPEMAMVLAQ
ncbi:hypothetical protein [Xanthomonas campestris]|uniref:hypothetical protein n=1 Tax=Xanthomonas campestris TaxID=339 RepID=UPI002B23619C|nr:hypothetical protein [Xanthomonas campestris]MEA9757695.1 hypothetical protein [Xanthomonas campestris pv. raphani]MEA9973118.1 hypothetical protein [Xanthomonas campestris pv. raphani]